MAYLRDEGFTEVGDRCFVARYASYDVNVGVVVGSRGLLVIDTRASEAEARVLLDDLRTLGRGPVVAVLNTHDHFDHTFGNAVLADEYRPLDLYIHENAAETLRTEVPAWREEAFAGDSDPRNADIRSARLVVPDHTFASVRVIDLGDREVEFVHPGRGHTNGDVVARVADADVLFAGDLVEESPDDHGGVPAYGGDSYPLDWATSLDIVVGMLTPASTVVPGHGAVLDREFVTTQRQSVSDVSELIRSLYGQGVGVDDALEAGGDAWPFPSRFLGTAVQRGYEHLAESGVVPGSVPAAPSPGGFTLPLA